MNRYILVFSTMIDIDIPFVSKERAKDNEK